MTKKLYITSMIGAAIGALLITLFMGDFLSLKEVFIVAPFNLIILNIINRKW